MAQDGHGETCPTSGAAHTGLLIKVVSARPLPCKITFSLCYYYFVRKYSETMSKISSYIKCSIILLFLYLSVDSWFPILLSGL